MSVPNLRYSKITKVMRHIALLPDEKVPHDEEFKFRERAKRLVEKWNAMLLLDAERYQAGMGVQKANGDVGLQADRDMSGAMSDELERIMEVRNLNLNACAGEDGRSLWTISLAID
jgi:hypothetical protein